MDPLGARHLAARIRAGVSIGTRIELIEEHEESGLGPGDRGIVKNIDDTGRVHVTWDRGGTGDLDPDQTHFRALAF